MRIFDTSIGKVLRCLIHHLARCVQLASVISLLLAAESLADDTPVKKASSNESIEETIETRDEIAYDPTTRSLFPGFYHKLSDQMIEWERQLGLKISLSYDVLAQGYTDNYENLDGAAGDLTLSGQWLLFGSKYNKPVFLTFRVRTRNALSDYPPSDISDQTGLLWRTTDGFNDSGFQIPSLYLNQEFSGGAIMLRYGQFSIDDFFDNHPLEGAKRYFLNQVFSTNPSVNFPSFGAGGVGFWQINDTWELRAGVSNIQRTGSSTEVDFKLTSTELFSTVEATYNFVGLGGNQARLQVMGWHSDPIADEEISEGSGVSATLEHKGTHPGDQYVFRYAYSNGESTATDTLLFAGFGREVRKFDSLGFGVGGGRSSKTGNWQGLFEVYYRWQVTKELVITPDVQLIAGNEPDVQLIAGNELDNDRGIRLVAGLRMGITF